MTGRLLHQLILIDVSSRYQRAFADWTKRRNLELLACTSEAPSVLDTSLVALAVVEGAAADLLRRFPGIRKALRATPVVALGEAISVADTVQLLRAGFRDVIELPAPPAQVVAVATEHADNRGQAGDPDGTQGLIGTSPAIERVRREIDAVASTQSTVLITGETGTGKGLAARLIHKRSNRRDRPFVQVDCGALAPSVVESELFGHDRGSFTGALGRRIGRFEAASDGTVFLDEISEMKPALQAKLLRVLQDREFERLGGVTTLKMPARVIAATNRDLVREVQNNRFRADLFYRLRIFHIDMPLLRERMEDISGLVRAGLTQLAERFQTIPPTLPDWVYARLESHDWPGNVRELMNVLERLVIHHEAGLFNESSLDDLVAGRRSVRGTAVLHDGPMPSPGSTEERRILEAELRAAGGNISRVARRLGMARSTLRYRMTLHNLDALIPDD